MCPGKANAVQGIIDAAVRGTLTAAQALALCRESPELMTLALLSAGKHIAEQNALITQQNSHITELQRASTEGEVSEHGTQSLSPSTPSGMVPVYAKANTPKRRKKPGAKNGHPGSRRSPPTRIDRRQVHRLKQCPHCGGRVQRCHRRRT